MQRYDKLKNMTTHLQLLPLGRYKHYKGHEYELIGVSRHSETLEELVVYRSILEPQHLWVRPLAMFQDKIKLESGELIPRFAYLGPHDC